MTDISKEHLQHIAHLARITLTDEQQTRFASQLSSIFEYIEKLNQVDVSNVEPTSQVTGLTNVTREDRVHSDEIQQQLLDAAPQTAGRHLKVKAILED